MMGKCDVWLGNALRELGVERKDYVVTAKVYWGNWATNWFGTEE